MLKLRQAHKIGSTSFSLWTRKAYIAAGILMLVSLPGCVTTKYVPPGEKLLRRDRVVVSESSVDPASLRAIAKQRANKRILGVPFYLYLYNLRDPMRVAHKRARKDSLCMARNVDREARGKNPRVCDNTLRERNGEAPVILDTTLTERSADQMRLYMQKKGWFRATVRDTLHTRHPRLIGGGRGRPFKRPQVDVEYHVDPGPAYHYNIIRFTVDDARIQEYVQQSWPQSLLKAGDRFDAEVLDAERARITERLRQLGYLYFNKELVQYDADTTVGDHRVDILLRLERAYAKKDRGLEGTPEGTVYKLEDVTLSTARTYRNAPTSDPDTLLHQGYTILYNDPLAYKPSALLSAVFLQPDQRFNQSDADLTYRRLSSLRVFDRIEINYDTTGVGRPGVANAIITLMPGKQQSLSLESYGTNRSGFLGTSVGLGYRHRNLFRGMGSIQALLSIGLEAQQSFTGRGSATQETGIGQLRTDGLFNTVDIGPEVTLRFPHFLLPIKRERFARSASPRTAISAQYNFQRRPDFSRTLAKVSFGYEWNETQTRTWGFFPMEVSVIRIPQKSQAFVDYLQQANNPVLTNSYTDHLIAGMRGQFTLNTQTSARQRDVFFARITPEWAGFPLFFPLRTLGTAAQDTSGNDFYTVAGIRYAEYVKLDTDLRWRRRIHEKSSLAFRVAAGAGLPYGNLPVLPFENSFFTGGANGLRAWQARSLGPGSYSAPLEAFDRIGEARLEANAEYRFKLIGFLEGALFTDVGNIWNWREDPLKPGAAFSKEFLSELAVGTGVGARLNFDFFIVRFDLGMQTKDPSLARGERWLFEPKDQFRQQVLDLTGIPGQYKTQFNFNIGIGYPF
jgi:outer membrane protein assembly factor BamA